MKIKEEPITTPAVKEEKDEQPEEMDTSEDKSCSGENRFAVLLFIDHFSQ